MQVERRNLSPLLRWAGGKRWLIPHVGTITKVWHPTSYIEPFVGGGAIFFAFDWPRPHLNDLNDHLIATYRGVAKDPEAVRRKLQALQVNATEFERVRKWQPRRDEWRAARLLFLNRCGYGGIYRTNRHGIFNVPFSRDRSTVSLLKDGRLAAASIALRGATMGAGDFEDAVTGVSAGSLVYFDPTYALPGPEESFRRYTTPVFTWLDQQRLANVAQELARAGALVLVSNAADPRVNALYSGALALTFKRRAPLPKARGVLALENLYILGPSDVSNAVHHELERAPYDDLR